MEAAKLECGLAWGKMKNSDSGHKRWIQTLNCFSYINGYKEEGMYQDS